MDDSVAEQEQLEDGWGPATPDDDTLLRQYVLAFADRVEHDAVAMGHPFVRSDLAVMGNTGIPFALANSVALLRPIRAEEWPELVDSAIHLCGRKPFTIWSVWPTPDLGPYGLSLGGHPPFMIRPAAPSTTPPPADLVIERVADGAGVQTFVETFAACYPVPELAVLEPGAWVDERVLRDDYFVFIGSVDGRPVANGRGVVYERREHGRVHQRRREAARPRLRRGDHLGVDARSTRAPRGAHRQRSRSPRVRAHGLRDGQSLHDLDGTGWRWLTTSGSTRSTRSTGTS